MIKSLRSAGKFQHKIWPLPWPRPPNFDWIAGSSAGSAARSHSQIGELHGLGDFRGHASLSQWWWIALPESFQSYCQLTNECKRVCNECSQKLVSQATPFPQCGLRDYSKTRSLFSHCSVLQTCEPGAHSSHRKSKYVWITGLASAYRAFCRLRYDGKLGGGAGILCPDKRPRLGWSDRVWVCRICVLIVLFPYRLTCYVPQKCLECVGR